VKRKEEKNKILKTKAKRKIQKIIGKGRKPK
jgi:hypothetical protein